MTEQSDGNGKTKQLYWVNSSPLQFTEFLIKADGQM